MAFYLGIDGGGSKTACAVGDESTVLATSVAAGCNVIRVGENRAREALRQAIRGACAAAGILPAQLRGSCAGIAGAARADIKKALQRMVEEIIPTNVEVVTDMEIALEAAFGGGPGVVVIAGTGSVAYGRSQHGETARAGGWGFAVSDEGSGHWIGRRAVAALLRARDEGAHNPLFERICSAWGVSSFEQFIIAANATPPPDFASLLPDVISVAEAGDTLSARVLCEAGTELAELARVVVRRLSLGASPRVAISGGVFRHASLVRDRLFADLRAAVPDVIISPEPVDPVSGALCRARRMFR